MNPHGWTKEDVEAFKQLLIKANTIQLNAAAQLVSGAIEDRATRESFEELGVYSL